MPRSREALVVVAVLAVVVVLGGVVMIVGGMTGSGHPAAAGAQSPAGVPVSSPGAAASGASGGQAGGAALCSSQRLAVDSGVYMVQNNEWGSGARECLAVGHRGGFTVTRSAIANSTSGAPGGYPSVYRGCHWGDVEAGFELWQGGAGLATDSLAVNVPGGGSAPIAAGPAAARPAPSSAPAAASVSRTVRYSVVHTWPGGLQAQAVLTNTSTSPVSGWTLTWSFAGDQRVTGLWNGGFTQSGKRVSVANASYNRTIAPSASVTIGFTGTSIGSHASPAAFQLNGTHCKT